MSKLPPASIRFNNPGAMYPGPSARKFGSTGTEIIGGGHKIAVFDDPVRGAAAQFDLLLRSYAGMPLGQAIAKWSGGNSSGAYATQIAKQAGLSPDAVLTPEMLKDPALAVPLARGMAGWEAGKQSPLSDDQWRQAHSMATGGAMPSSSPSPMPFSLAAPVTNADPASTPAAAPAAVAGISLPFGLSIGGAQSKSGGVELPEMPQVEAPRPLANMQRKPLDMSALMQLAATKRRGGIG